MANQYARVCLLLAVVWLWAVNAHGDGPDTVWTRTYGSEHEERAHSVIESNDGSFVATGWRASGSESDIYVVKTNADGDSIWGMLGYGGDGDVGYSIQKAFDGGYVVVGYWEYPGLDQSDAYMRKISEDGTSDWYTTYGTLGPDVAWSIQQAESLKYVVAGVTNPSSTNPDVYLLKTRMNGDLIWEKAYGGPAADQGRSVCVTADGGFVIAGWTYSYGAGATDVYLLKTNANGDTVWTKTYGGSSEDRGYSVAETPDYGYVITGYTQSFGSGLTDVYLIRTDHNGDTLWTRTYGGAARDVGHSVQVASDGGYIIAGSTGSYGQGDYDVYLVRTYANGDTMWTATYGGAAADRAYSIYPASDGGYIIAGYTESFGAGQEDFYLIKTAGDPAGVDHEESSEQGLIIVPSSAPNPFRERATIGYELRHGCTVSIRVYNLLGQEVKTLCESPEGPGTHTVLWDGTDNWGKQVSAGLYAVRLATGESRAITKVLRVR